MFDFNPANLFAGLLFGSIGFIAFVYGKRVHSWKPMLCGIALMVYPYFVSDIWLVWLIGGVGTAALFFLR